MRALWTAASGMKAQQLNMDNISNNLANVNTTSFKKQKVEFKDLLYQNLRTTNLVDGEGSPVNLQVGHGVKPVATTRMFTTGNLERTDNPLDMAIDGKGFFAVEDGNGNRAYTRDGNFKLSVDYGESRLVTSDGYTVLSDFEDGIYFEEGMEDITVNANGLVTAKTIDGEIEEIGTIALYNFANPEGLEATGSNLYEQTVASGEAQLTFEEERTSDIVQGYLETSNVEIVDEMVRLITAQRAYETNSKSIQTSDEMLGIANNLRR